MEHLPKATKRRDFIKRCKELGWTGLHTGVGDHPQYMEKDGRVLKIPNPHSKRPDIGPGLLRELLRQGGISRAEWLGETKDSKPAGEADEVCDR